jgi:hypothetical protein
VDQGQHDVLEHHAVRYATAVAAQRMADRVPLLGRQKSGELVPQGFQQAKWHRRHGSSV